MNRSEISPYDDIIELSRPKSSHRPMGLSARAAQFAPYATLAGHQDNVRQDEARADAKNELDQDIAIEYDEE